MSWFKLKHHNPKQIRGIVLRFHSNTDLIQLFKKNKNRNFFDFVECVIIDKVMYNTEHKGKVKLKFICRNLIDSIRRKIRTIILYEITDINPEWICDGNFGRKFSSIKE
jgi:hypothetical protein